jgi:hypothetical protein
MTRVMFRYNDGRERVMKESEAKVLQYVRRGTYSTRDMQAQQPHTSKVQELPSEQEETQTPVKRKPGRPRKQPDSE